MNEYLKEYIELQKQFRETKGNPDSVRALYTFKEKLELSEDKQAKEVLVDVYDLLDFKKDAYELLCQIGNRSDKKTLKRLGTLKEYAENWGNHYALPKPKTLEEKQKEKERQARLGLPTFRYHPNPLETGAFEESADGVACDCCGKTTHIFYTGPFYAVEDIECLCPECISSGEAARKYDGSFQDDCSVDDGVEDPARLDELIHRTPGYSGWQQEYWRAHCGDYCAYLGHVGARELRALGVLEDVVLFEKALGIGKRGEAGVEYRKVYFRIRSRYQFDSGWPAETDAAKFHEESRSLFQSAGWDLQPGGDSTSDTVIKGQQELYLHPMNFSGIIEMDEIPAIQELLKDAKSFRCHGFDCYERYWELTDKEYLAQLETKREEITHEILERCRTKRKNLYITGPVALNVAQKFSVHRLCDKEGKHNLANRFVGELMEQLVQDGLLVTTKTRNGPGVRTATDAEISSPLPGQQQMTL